MAEENDADNSIDGLLNGTNESPDFRALDKLIAILPGDAIKR